MPHAGTSAFMSREEKYNKSLSEKWCMRFRTKHPDGDRYDGVITHIKKNFLVIREEDGFVFDGDIVLPKRSIKSIRDGKYEECCNKVLRQNGERKRLHSTRWLNSCETIADVLLTLKQKDIWPGVEVLGRHDSESSFYIGPITGVDSNRFGIWCYDATGKWESEYDLNIKDVFCIQIENSYCRHFNNLMRSIPVNRHQ